MSQRYLAALAAAAVAILAGGLLLRHSLADAETPRPSAPPSEATALQQLSQEGLLRRMSEYVAQRIAAAAPFVVYLPETGAAGVRWRDSTIVTTGADRPVLALRRAVADSAGAPEVAADSVPAGWVLAVGRRADGEVVSAVGLAGGRSRTACADREVEQFVLSVPLPEQLAGAGLFTLDGRLLGLVVRCAARVVAVPAAEVARLRADGESPGRRVRDAYGLTAAALDAPARGYFESDSGVLVTAVRRGSPADAAGLQPGDVVRAVNGTPVDGPEALDRLAAGTAGDTLILDRRRGRSTAAVRLARRDGGAGGEGAAGIDVTPAAPARGVVVTAVRPGSAAYAAGVRPGDRLLRVGGASVRSPADARRLLAGAGAAPTFVVFERDSVARGVLLPR